MGFRNLGRDIKAEAEPLSVRFIAQLAEGGKQVRNTVRRDWWPLIRHLQAEDPIGDARRNMDRPVSRPVSDGIAQQVREHLRNAGAIAMHRNRNIYADVDRKRYGSALCGEA